MLSDCLDIYYNDFVARQVGWNLLVWAFFQNSLGSRKKYVLGHPHKNNLGKTFLFRYSCTENFLGADYNVCNS